MTNHASPVEDVATAIAATVRAKGWDVSVSTDAIDIKEGDEWIATLWCQDDAEAQRLAEMMRAPTPVFDAMNLPETPAFPSVRGKA